MIPHHMPWDKDYYLSVICLIPSWKTDPVFLWFDHNTELPTPCAIEQAQQLINECDIFAAQNLKYDLNILRSLNIDFENTKLHCTMVTDYLLNSQNTAQLDFNLNAISERRGLSLKLDKVAEYWAQGIDTKYVPVELLLEYVYDDTYKVLEITKQQLQELESINKIYDLHMEFVKSLSDMELSGVYWNLEQSKEYIKEYQIQYDKLLNSLLDFTDEKRLNLASPQQLSAFLYGGEVKVSWTDWVVQPLKSRPETKYYEKKFEEVINLKGAGFTPLPRTQLADDRYYSTDKGTITQLKAKTKDQKQIKQILVELSKIKKVLGTLQGSSDDTGLISKIQYDGHIHASLNQAVTKTGRLSSSDPNGQNLPRGSTSPIKICIIPSPHFDGVMEADLAQIEWRGAAWLSQDEVMIHEINTGVDQHVAACVDLMELPFISKADPESKQNRQDAKVFNFRMIYRGSWWGFYLDPNMPDFSKQKWQQIVERFFQKYHGLNDWHLRTINSVYKNHGFLRIPTGRSFQFVLKPLKGGELGYKESEIANYPVQGISGGDILPMWAVIIRRGMKKMRMRSKMVLTVHDSLLFNYVEEEKDRLARLCIASVRALPSYLSNFFKIDWNVNLDGEIKIGPNYGQLKEYEVIL